MESTNGHVQRLVAVATDAGVTRAFNTSVQGQPVLVDPAKSLFMFLQRLWFDLGAHQLHPRVRHSLLHEHGTWHGH